MYQESDIDDIEYIQDLIWLDRMKQAKFLSAKDVEAMQYRLKIKFEKNKIFLGKGLDS